MILISIVLFFTGLLKFFEVWMRFESLDKIFPFFSNIHDLSGVLLGILVFGHLYLQRKWIGVMTKKVFNRFSWNRRTLHYFINVGMIISFLIVFTTGLVKFPSILVSYKFLYMSSIGLLIVHDYSGLILELLVIFHLILHYKWIVSTTKKVLTRIKLKKILLSSIILGVIFSLIFGIGLYSRDSYNRDLQTETIQIAGLSGVKEYYPELIETIRPDLFREGHFSIFDILVYLDNIGTIDMNYYYDESMDTYVLDAINGEKNMWYNAYYEGGWSEENVFRIDHYPYKPNMVIKIIKSTSEHLDAIYKTFREEIIRFKNNDGSIIIPEVIINSPNNDLKFQNVEVIAHNLRNDFFQEGAITAIDVILSLADQDLITYKLNWYETIGANSIKSYYIDKINEDIAFGRCGFVYEVGDRDFDNFQGNHIHIPPDIRLLTSPEYEKWFWICT